MMFWRAMRVHVGRSIVVEGYCVITVNFILQLFDGSCSRFQVLIPRFPLMSHD